MGRDASSPAGEPGVTIVTRSLMGIYLPNVQAEHPDPQPLGSLFGGSAALDEASRAFAEALKSD